MSSEPNWCDSELPAKECFRSWYSLENGTGTGYLPFQCEHFMNTISTPYQQLSIVCLNINNVFLISDSVSLHLIIPIQLKIHRTCYSQFRCSINALFRSMIYMNEYLFVKYPCIFVYLISVIVQDILCMLVWFWNN